MKKLNRVLITGCANGIGEATAHRLLTDGYEVMGIDRMSPNDALHSREHFNFEQIDLLEEGLEHKLKTLFNSFNPHTIVHSAGRGTMGNFGDIELDNELSMVRLNIEVTLKLVHTAVNCLDSSEPRHIILLSSLAGISIVPGMATYSASKHFVCGLSKSVNEELKVRGIDIRVSTLTPPPVRSQFRSNMGFEEREKRITGVLFPEDIANDIVRVMNRPQQHRISGLIHRISHHLLRPLVPKGLLHRKIYETSLFDLRPLEEK